MTTPEELVAQALADLAEKAESSLAAIRNQAAQTKARLEAGMLNLQSQAAEAPATEAPHDGAPDLAWEFDPNLDGGGDDFDATPPETLSFNDEVKPDGVAHAPAPGGFDEPIDQFGAEFGGELHIATDDDGIPLGD